MERMRIRYRTNARKALEVILWCAAQRRGPVDFHTVLKVLFGADVVHVNRYGRPIVGDTYAALQYGPVPQMTYDLLKGEPLALEQIGMDELPFRRQGYVVTAHRAPDLSVFSPSELEALAESWDRYGRLSFGERTARSHDHPAWKNAWEAGKTWMDYADFLEGPNRTPEKIEDLAEVASTIRL